MKRYRPAPRIPAASLSLVLALALPLIAGAAPASQVWPRWQAHEPASAAVVDHGAWELLLSRYLQPASAGQPTLFRYAAMSAADKESLAAYIRTLEGTRVSSLNRREQAAYWINLYNALTVRLIVERYPVASIRDIRLGGLFSGGPWDAVLARVEGEDLSLNDIEHRILRPIWNDPRIHYAVNCASLGCPSLQARAYSGANLESLLDKGAREYINSPRGVRLEGGRLTLSSIYSWFAEDFGGGRAELFTHLGRYAEPALAASLKSYAGRISYDYDWKLNEPAR
jgi:hypothetical protein